MTDMIAPLSRIAARYMTGALATYGVVVDNGDVYIIIAALIGAVVESAYAFAKSRGGAT
jgi:hypothetical protein